MKCKHLIAGKDRSGCSALEKVYVPSLFEVVEYCKTIDHRKCPFYLREVICLKQSECHGERILVRK